MFSQMGIIVFVPFILPESCRWLMAKGDGENLLKILKRIARLNKKEVYSMLDHGNLFYSLYF